jgi:hypothetical protein
MRVLISLTKSRSTDRCPLWVIGGHHPIAPFELDGRFEASRHKPLLKERHSEDSTDYSVGICIETSAMAEQNTLRLPQMDFSDCRLRFLPLEE